MKLIYWGTWLERVVYIHTNCTVSHADFVESRGHSRDTMLIGCNAYVDSIKKVCVFCGEEFTGTFPHELTDKTLEMGTCYDSL